MSRVEKLMGYLQKHKDKYTMEKLKQHLVKFGYKLHEVEEAIVKVTKPAPAPPKVPEPPPASSTPPNITMAPGNTLSPASQKPTPAISIPPASPQPAPEVSIPPASPQPAPEIPTSPQTTPAETSPPASSDEPAPKKKSTRGFILVVDDDENIRSMLTEFLIDAGHRVTSASDGWQGVVQAEGLQIKLILSDIEMPGFGSGVDAFKKLRASPFVRDDLPVIFITGMVPDDARKIVPLDDPKVRLLFKPLDFALLEKHIEELI